MQTCNQPRSNTPDDALHLLSLESPWQRQSTSLMPNIENWLKWQISTRSALKTPTHSVISYSEVNTSC